MATVKGITMRSFNLSPIPLITGVFVLALSLAGSPVADCQVPSASSVGNVYVMTNKAEGNSVLVYSRAADGSLQRIQEAATNGLGTGVTQDPLMSQGALALSGDGKLLFAVNPASGTVTAFRVTDSGLQFGSKAASGGDLPVSLTE